MHKPPDPPPDRAGMFQQGVNRLNNQTFGEQGQTEGDGEDQKKNLHDCIVTIITNHRKHGIGRDGNIQKTEETVFPGMCMTVTGPALRLIVDGADHAEYLDTITVQKHPALSQRRRFFPHHAGIMTVHTGRSLLFVNGRADLTFPGGESDDTFLIENPDSLNPLTGPDLADGHLDRLPVVFQHLMKYGPEDGFAEVVKIRYGTFKEGLFKRRDIEITEESRGKQENNACNQRDLNDKFQTHALSSPGPGREIGREVLMLTTSAGKHPYRISAGRPGCQLIRLLIL